MAAAGLRKNALESEVTPEFAPTHFVEHLLSVSTSSSPALAVLKRLIELPSQCAQISSELYQTLAKGPRALHTDAPGSVQCNTLESDVRLAVLLCTVYSSRATRKTLVKCCTLFSTDLMGASLCDFLTLHSEVRLLFCWFDVPDAVAEGGGGAHWSSGCEGALSGRGRCHWSMACLSCAPTERYHRKPLWRHVGRSRDCQGINMHTIRDNQAVVSTFNFLLPALTAMQADPARVTERADFHALTALLGVTLTGAFTRDCVLLSALGICFAFRAYTFVTPASLAANLAYFFFPAVFAAPSSPVDSGLTCVGHTSALVRVAAARALFGCQDFATLSVSLPTVGGGEATLLSTVLGALFAVIDEPQDGSLHFLALQTLAQWLRGLCGTRGDGPAVVAVVLAPSSPLRAQLLSQVFAHWEHPIEVAISVMLLSVYLFYYCYYCFIYYCFIIVLSLSLLYFLLTLARIFASKFVQYLKPFWTWIRMVCLCILLYKIFK